MPDTAYLCCAMKEHTYPSFQDIGYDAESQTIACCKDAVPLLWLAIFRSVDMRYDFLNFKGPAFRQPAPVIHRFAVGKRLKESLPRIEAILAQGNSLHEYASHLREAIASVDPDFQFLTIEMHDVAAASEAEVFYDRFRQILDFMDGRVVADIIEIITSICALHIDRPILPLSAFIDEKPCKEDWENLVSMLGDRHDRDLPWIQR